MLIQPPHWIVTPPSFKVTTRPTFSTWALASQQSQAAVACSVIRYPEQFSSRSRPVVFNPVRDNVPPGLERHALLSSKASPSIWFKVLPWRPIIPRPGHPSLTLSFQALTKRHPRLRPNVIQGVIALSVLPVLPAAPLSGRVLSASDSKFLVMLGRLCFSPLDSGYLVDPGGQTSRWTQGLG